MKKRRILILTSLTVLLLGCFQSKVPVNDPTSGELSQIQERPNLVFYLADDQNILDYGCYGNEKVRTPAVDLLASQGVRFTQAFTAQAICAPSRSQLYTGKYPLNNGCFLNHVKTKPDIKSVTHYLSELGYEVVLAGKSHVKPKQVFDWTVELKVEEEEGNPHGRLPMDKIEEYLSHTEGPFCMFIASTYPHGPHPEVENVTADQVKLYPYDKDSSQQTIERKAAYYKHIENDNAQLEKVLSLIDQYSNTNTLFIYSADHGHVGKFSLYDCGLNVPFIVRWPGVVEAGIVSDKLIHYTDVLPTFLEAAGGKFPENIDGKSFLSILRGDELEIHDYVYGVQTNQNVWMCKVFPSRMIRNKEFKYIKNFNSMEVVDQNLGPKENVNTFILRGAKEMKDVPYEELYDIRSDPFEQMNLAKDPAFYCIKEELSAQMKRWMISQNDVLITHGPMPLLYPATHPLDKYTDLNPIPDSLQNTLNLDDYLILHY